MSEERSNLALVAEDKVYACRVAGNSERLAESLEELASALIKEADVLAAARALEEAASLWSNRHCEERQGSCLLLAASSRRLAGDLDGAKQNLVSALAANIPKRIKNGFDVEWCEQELASGRAESAYLGFTRVLGTLEKELDLSQQAQLYQRRAAAAVATKRWIEAAEDLLHTSTIFTTLKLYADAEASALAAAGVLADVDTAAAERIVSELSKTVPSDGAAATRRGLVGGKVALQAGDARLALRRFDQARQGALDMLDSVSYLTAGISASRAAEHLHDFEVAYSRLATTWATLSNLIGSEAAGNIVRPELEGLRERLGADNFAAVKAQCEKK